MHYKRNLLLTLLKECQTLALGTKTAGIGPCDCDGPSKKSHTQMAISQFASTVQDAICLGVARAHNVMYPDNEELTELQNSLTGLIADSQTEYFDLIIKPLIDHGFYQFEAGNGDGIETESEKRDDTTLEST